MARKIFYKEEIRLMTCDEFLSNQDNIPQIMGTWWLKDKGAGNNFGFIVGKNNIYHGDYITNSHFIRPIYISIFSSVEVGEEIFTHGISWVKFKEQKEDKFTTRHFYVAKNPIAEGIFDENTNIYENSAIKSHIDSAFALTLELDETEKEREKRLKREAKETKKREALEMKQAKAKEKKELADQKKAEKEKKMQEKKSQKESK